MDNNQIASHEIPEEVPETVEIFKAKVKYFPVSGRLAFCRPDWRNAAGKTGPGRTVTIDLKRNRGDERLIYVLTEAVNYLKNE